MPTKKQLYTIWESQFEFFGGSGQPVQTYPTNIDENGLTTQQHIDTPLIQRGKSSVGNGLEIGVFGYDPEEKDLKIIVNP